MARTKKQEPTKETATVVTRAEKKDATKNLIKERLAVKPYKHNELIEEIATLYVERFGGEDTDNINDVKGRVGSVLDIMKKDSDIMYEGGMYALKARALPEAPVKKTAKKTAKKAEKVEDKAEEKPAKKTTKKTVKKAEAVKEEPAKEEKAEEKPVKAAKKTTKKAKEIIVEKTKPLPPAPIQPIAPVDPVTPEVAPEPIPEEKTEPKKRGRKAKAKTETAEQPIEKAEEKTEQQPAKEEITIPETKAEEIEAEKPAEAPVLEEKPAPKAENGLIVKEKAEIVKKNVIDMSFLFGDKKPAKPPVKETKEVKEEKKPEEKIGAKPVPKAEVKAEEKPAPKAETKAETKPEVKKEEKPAPQAVKAEKKPEPKPAQKPIQQQNVRRLSEVNLRNARKPAVKPQTADEKLCEAFLKRIRSLGGDYFEYYSVYLLERYSMKNGRRLEGLRISGGDHDGGIDGEIELTDKLGFKETIYIQSKNWNPEKGDEKLWVVGETLLQQFIGACACRQAKDGKQNCRGIFITTSRFTPEAKRILDTMSDKIVGYDGNDLYEAAKECAFGLVEKNGVWALDEKLLSGSKAFFNLY